MNSDSSYLARAVNHIPATYIRECFDMDESGILIWKARPRSHFQTEASYGTSKRRVGVRACTPGKGRDYRRAHLTYNGKAHHIQAHRIVWVLTHGEWPTQFIDHINRIRDDNRPSNLRDVSHVENLRNGMKPPKPGRLRGAFPTLQGKFTARISDAGKSLYLGTFQTQEEAHQVYLAKRAELYGDVA